MGGGNFLSLLIEQPTFPENDFTRLYLAEDWTPFLVLGGMLTFHSTGLSNNQTFLFI
jgi:hypothetical protein